MKFIQQLKSELRKCEGMIERWHFGGNISWLSYCEAVDRAAAIRDYLAFIGRLTLAPATAPDVTE